MIIAERLLYTDPNTHQPIWDRFDVTEEEAALGFKRVDCLECDGVGLIPWLPWDEIEECIECKGTGKVYVNV